MKFVKTPTILFVVAGLAWMSGTARGERLEAQDRALYQLARGTLEPWTELTTSQRSGLAELADDYQDYLDQVSTPYDQIADIWWTDSSQSVPYLYDQIGDATTHTGEYLAGLAFHYDVTADVSTLGQIETVLERFDAVSQCSGRMGYLVRFMGPADDPAYARYYAGYGNGKGDCVAPWTGWIWLDHSSRDTYFGAAFGLAAAWALVPDPAVRDQVRQVVERVADRLERDRWWIRSPSGAMTRPTEGLKLTWRRLALSVNPARYAVWESTYASEFASWSRFGKPDVSNRFASDYYSFNLSYMYMWVLSRLETDTTRKQTYQAHLKVMFEDQSLDHLQALFAGLYASAGGDPHLGAARATAQGMLLEYPAPPRWMYEVDLSEDALYPLLSADYTQYAVHRIEDRPTDIYLWQRSPCEASGGAAIPYAHPGHDFFTAYWAGRSGGLIPAP